jgi:hypothetical protein
VLTYMATIDTAVATGILEVVPLPPWETRQSIRPLWATPSFLDLIEDAPEFHNEKNLIGRRTLYEHLWQKFSDFRCSQRPSPGDLHTMMPTKKGIWKMHPPGLRVYGWCPGKHSFVAVTYALEGDTKTDKTLNDKKRDAVLKFIHQHGLAETVKYGGYLEVFPLE